MKISSHYFLFTKPLLLIIDCLTKCNSRKCQLNIYLLGLVVLLSACGGGGGGGSTAPIANVAPLANAGSNQTVAAQVIVTLNASASSDSDGSISSYLWTQTAGTAVTLSNATTSMATFTSPSLTVTESLTFQVTVTDDDGATANATVSITVNRVNTAPVANAGTDRSVDEQTMVTLNASASSDTDGSIASYLWSQTAGTTVSLSALNVVNPSFTGPDVTAIEILSFEVTVTDNDGATDSATVNITINPVVDNGVPVSEIETSLFLNQLYFEYANRIGEKVWVLGYYGNLQMNADGYAYLVENTLHLDVDEEFPHHSFARLDGVLPPNDWQGNQILVYGEIKDYATETGTIANQPTPLISVEKYEFISTFVENNSWENNILPPDVAPENVQNPLVDKVNDPYEIASYTYIPQDLPKRSGPPTQAQACDRSVIISGGVDASGNYIRYKDNVVAKYNKMKELGFSDDQIEIFYNDGGAIDVNGTNVVDDRTDKEKIRLHLEKLAQDLPGSCTLTVFVTDHGTGYNPAKGYKGARPALSGDEATTGALYDENTFIFDARAKTYELSSAFVHRGKQWIFTKDGTGKVEMYLRVDTEWVLKGTNTGGDNADNILSETELGEDLNGDGDNTDSNYGFTIASLEGLLVDRKYFSNEWDTDRDGVKDVRLRWDGARFVVERLVGSDWNEMGRDTNGDYFIDIIDGGVDWNLDGDKADQIGFHEGINLWGREVLWDDEFATYLQPLADKGIHTMMEMVSCYSGGFVPNVGGLVENIYTGSSEETPHINRKRPDGSYFAADEISFLDNLAGIDTDSWNTAAAAATIADDALAVAQNRTKNIHVQQQTQRFETASIFEETATADEYLIELDLPDELVGQIYDYEFIYGLQKPRWPSVSFPDGLPTNQQTEAAPGGTRVFSAQPIVDQQILKVKATGIDLTTADQIRIEYTDVDHKRLGYTMVNAGDVVVPAQQIEFTAPKICVNHTDHGQSSPSVIEWLMLASVLDNFVYTDIRVTIKVTTPSGSGNINVTLNNSGQLYLLFQIFVFGPYQLEIVNVQHVPSGELLQLIGSLLFPITVTATETNKGQCTPSN